MAINGYYAPVKRTSLKNASILKQNTLQMRK